MAWGRRDFYQHPTVGGCQGVWSQPSQNMDGNGKCIEDMNMFLFYVQVKFSFVWGPNICVLLLIRIVVGLGARPISLFPHHDERCCSEGAKVPFEITGPKASKGHRPWLGING